MTHTLHLLLITASLTSLFASSAFAVSNCELAIEAMEKAGKEMEAAAIKSGHLDAAAEAEVKQGQFFVSNLSLETSIKIAADKAAAAEKAHTRSQAMFKNATSITKHYCSDK